MKYFCMDKDRKGTCYHEFYVGKWDEKTFWKEDSLLLHDDVLYNLKLDYLFREVEPAYDEYGETEINKTQWLQIVSKAMTMGGEIQEAISEADVWAKKVFETESVFTILGI